MTELETAASRRQQILNFLHANPGAKMAAIGACLVDESASRSRHHNTVHTMIEWGEVRAAGKPRCHRYWALVETTRPACEVAQVRMANVRKANKDRHVRKIMRRMASRGRYVHASDRPIRNQGGQWYAA